MMKNETTIQQPSSSVEIPHLPQEIIVEILSRLPVKSLGQFMCVSKLWLSLISDTHFAKFHRKQTVTNAHLYTRRKKLLISAHNLYYLEYESIGRDDDNLVALELHCPFKVEPTRSEEDDDSFWPELVGSCNGLVCASPVKDKFFIFNPSTRQSKRIPDMPSTFSSMGGNVFGFGYDSVHDDYKIVKADWTTVCVYSLRSDSWRPVGNFPYQRNDSEPGVFLNGAIHMMVRDGYGEDFKYVVAAFGLEKEVFTDLPAPDIARPNLQCVVGVLNGCLCVLQSYYQRHDDFWVMTEYGVGKSWTKLTFSLSCIFLKPLCMAQNGEALHLAKGNLFLHNLDDGNFRYLDIGGIPVYAAVTYLETLISPNGFSRT